MQKQGSEPDRISNREDEHDLRWELRGRLHAALQELDVRPVDWDVVSTLLAGAVEAVEAAT